MGKFTLKKSLKRYTANVLNFLLLFSLIVPNVLSPAIVIAQDLDIEQEESITEIPTIPIDESEDILEEGISTSTFEEGIYTVSLVEEKEYVYPEDDRVRIRFTSITEEGDLTIKKVILTEEEKLSLNTTDEYAWDFTSTMSNGSFTYDLVLPNNQGEEIEVKYSENGSTYTPIDEVLVNEGIVKISGLDHFTTFIVVPLGTIPEDVTEGTEEVDSTCNVSSDSGMFCYDTIQEAITASNNGDTINVLAGEYQISDTIVINKELTIIGASGAKLINIDTPAKTVFSITSSNVSIEGFEITHQNSFTQDSDEVARALIAIPDNANLTNIQIKDNLVYGNYPPSTAQKDMYTRGITVGSNGGTDIDITNNTIHSVRNGIVVRPTNTTNTSENTIYNTKGGIMHYTSSSEDADNRTMLDNEWTTAHNEWDIVWNSASYGFPDYQQSIIALGELNNDAYILDLRRSTPGGAELLEGNRNPVFVTTTGVDKDHQSTGNMNEPFATIQFAIDKVVDNGYIMVADGKYEEQIILENKNVNIYGESENNTKIVSPTSLTTTFENLKPIISTSSAKLSLNNLTIDGQGRGNANYRMVGVGLLNSSGSLTDVSIVNIKETPANGNQGGVGIYAYNSDSTERTIDFNSITVHDYQKNGLVLRGVGLTANLYDSLIYGFGDIDFIAQNGVQYADGATGTIQNNEIYGNLYTPSSWAATGILPLNAGNNLKIINNNIHHNGWGGIYAIGVGTNLEIINNHIHDNLGDGIILYDGLFENALIKGNTVKNNDYGIWLDTDISPTVQITENIFDNKEENAADESAYYYDNGVKGNYWSDYTGIDLNGDGIGETPYDIDGNSSDRYPLTTQHLSATVNYVNAHKEYYKEGDVLSIDVEVTNNGSIPLDPTKEQLVINITNPSGTYISGTFRGKALLDLQPGETKTYEFYTTEQTIPDTWVDGTYRIHSSIYSQRTFPLNYLVGGQNHSETFIVDSTKPSTPEFFAPENDLFTNINFIKLEWTGGDDTLSGTKGYILGYTFTPANGGTTITWNTGLREVGNPYWHSGTYGHGEGKYEFWVKTVDNAGNESLQSEILTVTYDKTTPNIPTGLTIKDFEGNVLGCSGYTNNRRITVDWDDSEDINFSHYIYGIKDNEYFRNLTKSINTGDIRDQDGEYKYIVRAVDKAGNISEPTQWCNVTLDRNAPIVEITNPSDNKYVKGIVDFRGTVQDTNLLRYYYKIQDTTSKTITTDVNIDNALLYTWDTTAKADGSYELRLEARDKADNKDNNLSVDIINVIVDNTLPTVQSLEDFSINEGSTIPTKQVLVEDNYEIDQFCFSITSDIGDVSETCISPSTTTNSWDVNLTDTILTELSNTYGITTTTADTSLIPEGDYTISYHSIDKAGNESTPHTFIVTIENVLPTVFFSSSTTELLEGNSVSFNGSFTDPGLDDSNWTFTLSFGDGTADVLGTLTTEGNIFSNYSHQYTNAGDYTASLKVCEDGGLICTTDTIDITVGEVQGVTTGSSTTTTKPTTLVKKVTTYIADILGVGGEGDVLALEEDEETLEDDEEVKGSQTCDNPSTISGYIYIDSNENGEKDEGERAFPEISIRIYTITEGMEETVKQIVSDENGYWETTLCSGDYYISVDDSKLPNNYVLEEDTLGVQVEEDKDSTLNFEVLDERNFLQKYWPWILLAVGILGSIGIVAVDTRRKKEYI